MVEKKKNEGRNELFKRLTQLFRGGPSIKRKVRAFRTPTASTATEVFKKSYSQVYSNALNAYGQYDRMCIDINKEYIAIPGESEFKSIRDLSRLYPNGEKFLVYAFDHKTNEIVTAYAHHPRSSGFRNTIKVTLIDDTTLVCTPDHPCMMSDGSYKDAGDLALNDSMMSLSGYKNVKSIEQGDVVEVGDLTVDSYENFATNSIIVHNSRYADFSEMEYTPEIASTLDIYSEEATSVDDRSVVLHVYSNNPKIQSLLNELFHDVINVEYNLTPWTRNLVKYGDFFLFIDVHPEMGVINVFPMPINEVERDEGWDPQDPLAVRYRWVTQGNQILESWQVAHFRLSGNDSFLPYGSSVLESARRIWRQLILIEDAMLVYRVVRSPERRVFYIDVGAVPTEEIPNYMEAAQTKLKRSPVIDKSTGRIDLRYNPLSVDEDYFIPVRGDSSGTRIDSLAGGQHVSDIADVEYIQKKLFAALKVPRAYLGYDENLSSKATLAQEDIRFSRSISRIQRVLISELQKIAIIHLFAHGFEGDDLADFSLFLSNPSTVAQQQKLELWRTKFEIAGSVPEGLTDRDFLRREIFQLTDEQIEEIKEGRKRDRLEDMELEATELEGDSGASAGGGGGLGGGLGGLPGSSGGDDFGIDDAGDVSADASGSTSGAPGGDEETGESGEKEDLFAGDAQVGKELLDGLDVEDDDELPESDDMSIEKSLADLEQATTTHRHKKGPTRATPLSKYLYDRGRLRTHGARKTHMPNFKDMVSFDADPNDSRFFNANPFSESRSLQGYLKRDLLGISKNSNVSAETKSMLAALKRKLDSFGKKRSNSLEMLTESDDIDINDELVDISVDDIDFDIDDKSESEYEDNDEA